MMAFSVFGRLFSVAIALEVLYRSFWKRQMHGAVDYFLGVFRL
jgi:hypothetical protein